MSSFDSEIRASGVEIIDLTKSFYFMTRLPEELISSLTSKTTNILASENSNDYSSKLAGKIYDGQQVQIDEELCSDVNIKELILIVKQVSRTFVQRYMNKINYESTNNKFKCDLNDMWIVSQKAHDYNPPHDHPWTNKIGLSGVLYLKVPPQINGDTTDGCFHFSWGSDLRFNLSKFSFAEHANITPDPGMLLLFPSSMVHEVFPFRGDGERRCIAFNIDVKFLETSG